MVKVMDRRVVASVLMAAAFGTAVSFIVKNHEARRVETSTAPEQVVAQESKARPMPARFVPEQQRSLLDPDPSDAAILAQLEHRYRFLIPGVEEEHIDELRRRLLERESRFDAGSRSRVDAGIEKLLSPESVACYRTLKDSDLEGDIGKLASPDEELRSPAQAAACGE